jgi:hypothetical protein
MNINSQNDALLKLIKISSTVVNDDNLISEFKQEIKNGSNGALCSMYKSIFKRKLLDNLGIVSDFLSFFFQSQQITEFDIHSSPRLGIKCFFMPKGSSFPLHDHNNQVVCTGVLYGKIKYMTLEKIERNRFLLSKKATANMSAVLFCTREYRNIHSILALEDSIILDIFIENPEESDDLNLFKVVKKRGREFELEEHSLKDHKGVSFEGLDS